MSQGLWWVAGGCAALGALLAVMALTALWRRRWMRSCTRLLLALTLIALGTALGAIGVGIEGYRALTREELAATVQTEPLGAKRFRAHFRFPDGHEVTYVLSGDELYVDARVLKWSAAANFFGLHTAYELDRVAGRYVNLGDEQQRPRTVYSLGQERLVDLFGLRKRYALLSPLFDADYGSATFVAADEPAQYEVRVSTTGLLVRRVEPTS